MTVTAEPVPILSDNYAWLLRDSSTGATAIADPADAGPVIAAIERAGGRLDLILLTPTTSPAPMRCARASAPR